MAFPGQPIETGYHGASAYVRGEPVDIIFDSDFSRFDRQSGIYRCQVPTSFRGQRIDAIQLSACSLDINNPNSNPSEDSGTTPGSADAKSGSRAGVEGDLAGGSGILPTPPRLYMERMVSYSTGSSQYNRPIFDGYIRLHNRSEREAHTIQFPAEYMFFRVQNHNDNKLQIVSVVAPQAAPGAASTGSHASSAAESMVVAPHGMTDYDIKYRLMRVLHGMDSTLSIDDSKWPPKRVSGATSTTLSIQLNVQSSTTVAANTLVALQLRPFNGYAEVSTRINECLKGVRYIHTTDGPPSNGTDYGIYVNYSTQSGLFSVGPPDVVYIPDGQPPSGRAMCGLTVCQCLGLQSGTDGKEMSPPPQIVRRSVVTIAEGNAPIAYALQSGQHLANAIRNAYARTDPRLVASGVSPSVAVMTVAGTRLKASLGTDPFRSVGQMCAKVAYELKEADSNPTDWTVKADPAQHERSVMTVGTSSGDVMFQVLGTSITLPPGSLAGTEISTESGLRMLGLMNGVLLANDLPAGSATATSFGSRSARGVPVLQGADPRFGTVHLFQPDRELRESTVGAVTGRPPVMVRAGTTPARSSELITVQFAISHNSSGTATSVGHPFHAGDLLEAFHTNGTILSTRFLVVDESSVCSLLPLNQISVPSSLSDIKSFRRITYDDERLYTDVTMTQTTNIFVHEHDMGTPGPDSADVPQPVVAFGTRRLGDVAQLGVNVAMNRSPNMHRHSCSPDVDVVYVRLVHSNIYTNKVPSLPSEVGRASGILGRITHHNSQLAMDRSQSGSASFPGGTRLPSELQFQFLDQAGQVIRSGLKKWSLTCTIPNRTLNLDRA